MSSSTPSSARSPRDAEAPQSAEAPLLAEQPETTLYQPLADRVRPRTLAEVRGQRQLLGEDRPLSRMLASGHPYSMVLWGPPGVGKTTLVRIIARMLDAHFVQLSAVNSGVKEIRTAIAAAHASRKHGRVTVLFVDEVHRFNKAQQDGFLPYIEDGTIIFIGATTENPAFELNNALLSRLRVHVLKPLTDDDVNMIVDDALAYLHKEHAKHDAPGKRAVPSLTDEARGALIGCAHGDARDVLNLLEAVLQLHADDGEPLSAAEVVAVAEAPGVRFDNKGDLYYDQISALHKSIRGSNPDAALYWLSRMLQGGMSPTYIARRLVRIASEDIGNADPRALPLALHAWDAWERLGTPEGELALAHATSYLASCPKSDAVYRAFNRAWEDAAQHVAAKVPMHLRNASTRLAKNLGHGVGYRPGHNEEHGYSPGQEYFPSELGERRYYEPVPRGLENRIRERLAFLADLDKRARRKGRG